MVKDIGKQEITKLNDNIVKNFFLFLFIAEVGASIAIIMSSKAPLDKFRSVFFLIAFFGLIKFIVKYIQVKLQNQAMIEWSIFLSIIGIYFLGYAISLEKTLWTPVNWLPTYFLIIFTLFNWRFMLYFIIIHFSFAIYLMVFVGNNILVFESAHYISNLTNVLVLSIIAFRYIKIFKFYQSELHNKLTVINEQNLELNASNEEYYAAQEELFQQYDQIKELLSTKEVLNEQLITVLNVAQDAIVEYNIEHETLTYSKRLKELFPELDEKRITIEMLAEQLEIQDSMLLMRTWRALLENKQVSAEIEVHKKSTVHENESEYFHFVLLVVKSTYNDSKQVFITIKDITDQKRFENKILNMAYYDDLTNLLNRKGFEYKIEEQILNNPQKPFLFFLINISEFHSINNVLGFSIGDLVLKELSIRVMQLEGQIVLPSRLSADNFAFALNALTDIRLVKTKLEEMMFVEGHQISIRISCGVTEYPKLGTTYLDLIRQAEQALSQSKSSTNLVHYTFDSKMIGETKRRLSLINALRKATIDTEFYTFFQPIVEASTGKTTGFEALVRWNSPEFGNVSPAEFIPLAEKSGVIDSISRFVLKSVCQFYETHKLIFNEIVISINLSPVQFMDMCIPDILTQIVDSYNVPHDKIAFEITETIFMENFDQSSQLLVELKNRGFKVYLDDFGTGYSSLSYLSKLPIDVLKIDKSFTDEITLSNQKHSLFNSIISLGKNLDMKIVVEGVETKEQLQIINKNDQIFAQGYLFSKPVSGEEAIRYFRQRL